MGDGSSNGRCDVLVVGAGPTGLTLAAQLRRFGAAVRIVDLAHDRMHESRALAVQPRTLEVLRGIGLADELLARGNPALQIRIHAGTRETRVRVFDIGLDDTAFPFPLFVSQAETEAVLEGELTAHGLEVERDVRFVGYRDVEGQLTCTLRYHDGAEELVSPRYLVGCDGARSTVREHAGIPFVGARYPQTFLLADLDVDGLETGSAHAFLSDRGPLLFFPLDRPAPWRVITMRSDESKAVNGATASGEAGSAYLVELQRLCDDATPARLRLRDPVWATAFTLHHRHAASYRAGRVFLAGDAAHVHSPAGGQGMNTGIQDAWNLGWKLALVCRGVSPESLLDSYDEERRPVGQFVLRFTDRLFTAATSTHPVIRFARTHVVPRMLPVALRFRAGRAAAFRTVSQLGIRYRHSSAIAPTARWTARGPRAGDRLPDARVSRDGDRLWLHEALDAPAFHLLLCGQHARLHPIATRALTERYGDLIAVHRLARGPGPGVLVDPDGRALARLHSRANTGLLVRPDGHIAQRTDGCDLAGVELYLARWLAGTR
jgi:2-polyprenyl-6-methoxyphenol hydroxylase-like FAD-dependent oxidoreductase